MLTTKSDDGNTDPNYQKIVNILESQDHAAKLMLAENRDIQPEVLYFLASDTSADVRRLVALNPATPRQANYLLAYDENGDIRGELARKIARLLPDMPPDEQSFICEKTVEILEVLAKDQLPKVRAILAEELKLAVNVPKAIVLRLAQDLENIVCVPVLEYSPLLVDDDLKEIIAAAQAKEAISAIARRRNVSEDISDAIAASLDIPAVAALLANPRAQIREETLDMIAEQAEQYNQWQEPLVKRPNLSIRTMRRLACFVAASLVSLMIENNPIGDEEAQNLLTQTKERIQSEAIDENDQENIAKTIAGLYAKGLIDDHFIQEAIMEKKRDAVTHALVQLSGLSLKNIQKITSERDGKKITALAWKAGLNMRTAYLLQTSYAFVPAGRILNARNGIDYPLTPAQLAMVIEFYQD